MNKCEICNKDFYPESGFFMDNVGVRFCKKSGMRYFFNRWKFPTRMQNMLMAIYLEENK